MWRKSFWDGWNKIINLLLKKWMKKVQHLEEHYKMMEEVIIEEKHIQQEKDLSWKIFSLSMEEEIFWRLKSRSLWLQFGDFNKSLFHKQAKSREARNRIKEIVPEGKSKVSTFDEIKEEAYIFFKYLLSEYHIPLDLENEFLQVMPWAVSSIFNHIF